MVQRLQNSANFQNQTFKTIVLISIVAFLAVIALAVGAEEAKKTSAVQRPKLLSKLKDFLSSSLLLASLIWGIPLTHFWFARRKAWHERLQILLLLAALIGYALVSLRVSFRTSWTKQYRDQLVRLRPDLS